MAANLTNYTQAIGKIIPGSENTIDFSFQYILSLPSLIKQGDYFAIMISLIVGYFLLILLNKISGLFLAVIKKIISFAITLLALLFIYNKFMSSLAVEGLTSKTLIIGAAGIIIGILGTVISFYSLFSKTKTAIVNKDSKPAELKKESEPGIDMNQIKDFKTFFSLDSLKNDKSLLSVLTFLVVAEFGVFSSKTVSAPNIKIGLIMFAVFMTLAFVFIKQSYKSYSRGLVHILVTFVLGSALAIILGHYWSDYPYSILFSTQIFATECVVALISGMALSLFAGSKS
jgi:hypothetical protein